MPDLNVRSSAGFHIGYRKETSALRRKFEQADRILHVCTHTFRKSRDAPTCSATSVESADLQQAEIPADEQQSRPQAETRFPERDERVEAEGQRLLEWPALCRQVASFATISLTARRILQNGLYIGTTQEDSEKLQAETAEAARAELVFGEIYNLFPVVEAAQEDQILNTRHLSAVVSTMQALDQLVEQLSTPERNRQADASTSSGASAGGRSYPSLSAVVSPAAGGAPSLVAAIQRCIGTEDGRILDRSSAELAAVRQERGSNLSDLRSESERWARQVFAQKASENAQVMNQRGRLCVSVKAGRQGELPKGSVKVGASRTGATLYYEPQPLVELNNSESWLAGREAEEERKVLEQLTGNVAEHASVLLKAMHAILELDTINARAQHGLWLSGTRPEFYGGGTGRGSVHLPGARHPLLMQRALPPLPALLEHDESEFESSFMGGVSALQTDAPPPETETAAPARAPLPRPVDLTVPPGTTSVILTGPNTGGKTASLKTLGLLVLMAKAGLCLPLDASSRDGPRGLEWFGKVLVDIGDSQDLAQSLSTFSGHVHRLKAITSAVDSSSLVLLDELGSGTDPVEGGPLAAVLLEWLLPKARLTFCTSHHAELKELSAADGRFLNANVEFDTATLMPTYRLRWGEAGESQALAVAEGLGFDREIISAARAIAGGSELSADRSGERANQMEDNLSEEVEKARRDAAAARSQREAAEAGLAELEGQAASLKSERQKLKVRAEQELQEVKEASGKQTRQLLSAFSAGRVSFEEAAEKLERLRSSALEQRAAARTLFSQTDSSVEEFVPKSGDAVRLLSMGGKIGKVVKAPSGGGKLAVRMGKLTVNVRQKDVARADSSELPAAAKKQRAKNPAAPPVQPRKREILRIQIPDNTADLRGMRQTEAVQALERAFDDCPDDSVLFVVHGHGTGAVKTAVRQHLQRHAMVKRYYEEPESAGGCTVVEFN